MWNIRNIFKFKNLKTPENMNNQLSSFEDDFDEDFGNTDEHIIMSDQRNSKNPPKTSNMKD